MIPKKGWVILPVLVLLLQINGALSGEEIVGANVAGLHAGIKTNLFDQNGPLAKLNAGLEAGANALLNDLTNGMNQISSNIQSFEKSVTLPSQIVGVNIGGLKAGLSTNIFGGSEQNNAKPDNNLVGVNVLGLKAGIKTNLFGNNGPIAQAENGLATLENNAKGMLNSLNQGASSLMSELTGGVSSSVSGSASISLPKTSEQRTETFEFKIPKWSMSASGNLNLGLPSMNAQMNDEFELPSLSENSNSVVLLEKATEPNVLLDIESAPVPPKVNAEMSAELKIPSKLETFTFPNLLEGITLPNLFVNVKSEGAANVPNILGNLEETIKLDLPDISKDISETLNATGNLLLPTLNEIDKITLPSLEANLSAFLKDIPKDLSLPKLIKDLEVAVTDLSTNKQVTEAVTIAGVIGIVILLLAVVPELVVAVPGLAMAAPEITAALPEITAILPEISAAIESQGAENIEKSLAASVGITKTNEPFIQNLLKLFNSLFNGSAKINEKGCVLAIGGSASIKGGAKFKAKGQT